MWCESNWELFIQTYLRVHPSAEVRHCFRKMKTKCKIISVFSLFAPTSLRSLPVWPHLCKDLQKGLEKGSCDTSKYTMYKVKILEVTSKNTMVQFQTIISKMHCWKNKATKTWVWSYCFLGGFWTIFEPSLCIIEG